MVHSIGITATDPEWRAESTYTLGRDAAETDRLRRQARELREQSIALLEKAGDVFGEHAIDLGCGPAGIIELLAQRVGPAGRVIGIDADARHVAGVRELATARGLEQVEAHCADASQTGLPATFQLVHARTLLVNVPDPAAVVAEMVRLARPGGRVLLHEPDMIGSVCEPRSLAFERLLELLIDAFERERADPFIGRRLVRLLGDAGAEEVDVEGRVTWLPAGHSRRTILPDLVRSLRPKILACGLITESELDRLDAETRAHLRDPRVATYNLFFLAHARKPLCAGDDS